MTAALEALAPIFLLIVLGWGLKRWQAVPDSFWPPAEKLTYYLFFPALLVLGGARADLDPGSMTPMVAAVVLATLTVAAVAWALKGPLNLADAAYTSLFQATIRPNTYVGIGAAVAFYGDAGLALTSACVVFVVPLVNVLSVWVLAHAKGRSTGSLSPRDIIFPIVTNPIILACLLGFVINIGGLGLPPVITPLLEILGKAALPVGLLAVGAGLVIKDMAADARAIGISQSLKLLLLPGLTYGLGVVFGAETEGLAVAVIYAALPVSASSYVLARQMGGDAALMSRLITASTLAAMALMPITIFLISR